MNSSSPDRPKVRLTYEQDDPPYGQPGQADPPSPDKAGLSATGTPSDNGVLDGAAQSAHAQEPDNEEYEPL